MTTYSGRHKENDRLSTKWNQQKIKRCITRKPDSIISDSGYSSSNSKDSFLLSDQTNPSDCLHSPPVPDTGSDDLVEKNKQFKETVPEEQFETGALKNQHENGAITPELKQSATASNNCVHPGSIQKSTNIQSSKTQHLNVQNSAHIKLNRLSSGEDVQRKQKRFNRTAKALRDSGLLPIAIQTGHLLKKNLLLQREIDKLKKEAELFVQSFNAEENVSENTTSNDSDSE